MSADLWETAANLRPHALATLSGKRRYGAKAKPKKGGQVELDHGQTDQRRGDAKSILIRNLWDLNYDVENRMGSILKSKYTFNSLWMIRKAY